MRNQRNCKSELISIEDHIALLLGNEGKKIPCDDTTTVVIDAHDLPPWYDETKFKRGQAYYQSNLFGMFVGKLCGLISILAIPTILNILVYTRRSGTCFAAYRRYVATILHMNIWYSEGFYPGSKSWRSIIEVRKFHCSASRRACSAGFGSINQTDMAITQFGFMGFAVARSHMLGLTTDPDGMEGFVHFWRVIGCILGIEDRFNICRESVSETKQVCDSLITNRLRPGIRSKDPTFLCMSAALLQGMWYVNPFLTIDSIFTYLYRLTKPEKSIMADEQNGNLVNGYNNNDIKLNNVSEKKSKNGSHYQNNSDEEDIELGWWSRLLDKYLTLILTVLLKYRLLRMYFNQQLVLTMFLLQNCAFLTWYRFGIKNSSIRVPNKSDILHGS